MFAHSSSWGHFAIIAGLIAIAVLARAILPLIRSVVLLIGLIGAAVAVIASTLAFVAVIFAGLAGWAGWDQPSLRPALSADAEPLRFAVVALAAALGGALVVIALFAPRLWRRTRD